MENIEDQYQRRAVVGERHFILADRAAPDVWALPGPVVLAEDDEGVKSYGPPRTVTTAGLRAYAAARGLSLIIEEHYPVIRRVYGQGLAA